MRLDCFLWKTCYHGERVWIRRLNCWAKIRSWELTYHSSTFSILPPAAPHACLQVDLCPLRFLFIQGSSCGHVEVCPDWYACLSVSRWAMHRHSSCLVNHTNQKILWYRYVPRSNLGSFLPAFFTEISVATGFNAVSLPGTLISSINLEVMYYVLNIGSGERAEVRVVLLEVRRWD